MQLAREVVDVDDAEPAGVFLNDDVNAEKPLTKLFPHGVDNEA